MAPGSVGSSGSASSMSAAVGAGGGGKKQRRERTSVCSFCNMTFNKKEHLQRHERTHTLDRPYICDFAGCGKTFARRDTLTRHTRLHKREDGDDAAAAAAAGGGPGTGSAPSSSSAPSSLRVPKPARKRRARNGSATSTLAHDDSTENEDGTSSSAEAEAGGPDDDFHLDHKLPAKRLQSMTIAHAAAIKDEDDDDEEEEEAEVKSEFSEEGARQTRQAMVAPPANLGYVPSLLAATNAVVAAEEAKSSFYNWNKYSASKDGAYLIPHSPPASSSLGLDIALPATAGPASFEDNNNQQPINHAQNELPGFVQATQHDFRIFRPITSNNHQSIHDLSTQPQPQFQQQSPAQQPGWQQQSFLAGSPGRSNIAQLPQLNTANDPAARRSAISAMNAAAAAPITSPVIGQAAAALPNNSPSTASINISPAGAYQSLPLPIPIAQPPHMQQRPQMAMPNPGHRARQFSMDYSPMDGESSLSRSAYSASPASVDSFLSLGYTGSSPNSVASSLPSLSAAQSTGPWEDLSKDFNVAGYSANPSSGGDMPAAFKKANNAFTQPLTMGIGLHAWLSGASSNAIPTPTTPAAAAANTAGTAGSMWGRSGADSDTKKHLYMLMRAAETPTDEFLRWPSRDSSPAFGMSTSYSSSSAAPAAAKSSLAGSSSVSSGSHGSARTASSFIDFGEYNSTQAALFGEAAPHSRKDMVVPHSPIASLEQWLGRHGQDMSAESMVF